MSDNSRPLLSICLVTYNHENFIYDCLASIKRAELDFNFEIIIGNDKSTDNTVLEIQRFIKDSPGFSIQLVQQQKNLGGQGNAFNILAKGKGKYFLLLDGDDYWNFYPEQFKIRELLENQNVPIAFSYQKLYTESNIFKPIVIQNISLEEALDDIFFHFGSVFIPRKMIDQLLKYSWTDKFNFLDRPLQIEIVRSNRLHIVNDTFLSVYRQHTSSASYNIPPLVILKSVTDMLIYYFGFNKKDLSFEEKEIFLKRISINYLLLSHPKHIINKNQLKVFLKDNYNVLKSEVSQKFAVGLFMKILLAYFIKTSVLILRKISKFPK